MKPKAIHRVKIPLFWIPISFAPFVAQRIRYFEPDWTPPWLAQAIFFKIQQLNADEGLEVIEPVRAGIHSGCWYLRNPTYRGETFPAVEGQYRSIVEALEAAIDWWQAETWCRGVMVRVYDINHKK
jgi:hypothetical protein